MTVPFADTSFSDRGVTARVPRAHLDALCAGHFPGDPIVPGAYVAGLLAELSAMLLTARSERRRLTEVERCTFLAPLRPADDVMLIASAPETRADGLVITAEVRTDGNCVARGRFRFA